MRYIVFLLLLLAIPSNAGVSERAAEIYMRAYTAYAGRHPGFRIPDTGPTVHVVKPNTMQNLARGSGGGEGKYYGLTDANGVIYTAECDIDTAECAGTWFHEMVHFLQYKQRGQTMTCADAAAREEEAYSLEILEMERLGQGNLMMKGRMLLSQMLNHIATECKDK